MVEAEKNIGMSSIIEKRNGKSIIRLHLASYFRVMRSREEQERILISHGLELVYDPVRITPEINEELWKDQYADKNGFFTFLPRRLVLGHTLESIEVPANIALVMREFFYSEKTGEILPLITNCGAPLIHPLSTGPQTYEIFNMSNQPLSVRVSELICFLDVHRVIGPSVLPQQKLSKGEFGDQVPGKIKLGNPGRDWETNVIRKALGLP